MHNGNGKADPGPMFLIAGPNSGIASRTKVLELLEASAAANSKTDLRLGPALRKTADDFRQWSKVCEPGWIFQAPEIQLGACRLATGSQVFTSLSDDAMRKIQEQAKADEPVPDDADLPRIFRP